MDDWLDKELEECCFKDKRLEKRFKNIVRSINNNYGKSIPQAFENWSEIKGVYRFLSNENVTESDILNSHFLSSKQRIDADKGPVLVLHDTSEFSYKRKKPEEIGFIGKSSITKRSRNKIPQAHKVCGILMHSSLAITSNGLPLGLTSSRFWTRKVFKNTTQMKRHINPTRVPLEEKESIKWLKNLEDTMLSVKAPPSKIIHVCDRESDMYEFFAKCRDLDTFFIVRSCVNRMANESTIQEELSLKPKKFAHKISFQNGAGKQVEAKLDVFVKQMTLHPPHGKSKGYADVDITVISAIERSTPSNREKIKWTLLTNLPVKYKKEAIQSLNWYKQRWKIEEFFKVLKSGLRLEGSKLRTASRLGNLIATSCILAWRIFWSTVINRISSKCPASFCFNSVEIKILNSRFPKHEPKFLNDYILLLAKLGGYIARRSDPPPGNSLIWRGYNRLKELYEGFILAENYG